MSLISGLERESLLNTTVEEESDVSVFLGLGNVDLVDSLGTEGFGEDVTHVLRLECNWEWVVELVLCHGGESDVLWVGKVLPWGTVCVTEKLSDFSYAIRSVVEKENLVVV